MMMFLRTGNSFLMHVLLLSSCTAFSSFQPTTRTTSTKTFTRSKDAANNYKPSIFSQPKTSSSSLTQLFSTTDDDFMASLRSRVAEVSDRETKMPLVSLDSMLPRQVLKLQCSNPLLMELLADCFKKESPHFGMMGMARLSTGQRVHLKTGVEVEIVSTQPVDRSDNDDDDEDNNNRGSVMIELKAGRRFVIEGEIETAGGGWTEARVQFLDSEEQEMEESDGDDPMSIARAMSKAKQFTSPNLNMKDSMSLVDRWCDLARKVERQPGQIDDLLEQLGEIPPETEPSERAFWVGALINPIPAMGVALEVRPALLTAKTAEERVRVAYDGILKSIKHMDGSARMW